MIIAAIVYILVGLVVGFLARLLLPGRDPIGILGTILLGIAGAVIGGFVWEALFGDNRGVSWIGSVLMAMLLLWIYRKMTYGRSVTA
ncbi:MAG: GlsB/YeaQ/YmgE family stress response membrane protein [Actinomycetota bacterium]|nr:GlsB/YeaQ/YmgE family stress response membrane protein [Actinomycetota bacterium]